jgi:hypothetical protein
VLIVVGLLVPLVGRRYLGINQILAILFALAACPAVVSAYRRSQKRLGILSTVLAVACSVLLLVLGDAYWQSPILWVLIASYVSVTWLLMRRLLKAPVGARKS